MRPIYGALKIFGRPYAHGYTFAEIFNGLLFWSILRAYKIWSS